MHFTIEQEDATTIFRLKEPRLDSLNASALKAEFLILAQPDVETLIVDLSEVQHVDSAGLSALLLAERQQAAHGGEVRLVGANDNLKSLLSLTQLDRVFATYDTLDSALDHEPSFGDDDDDEQAELPGAPTRAAIRAGAISAGGSLGAAQITNIMMGAGENSLLAAIDDEDEDYDDEEYDEDDDVDEVDLIEDEAAADDDEEDAEEEDLLAEEDLEEVDDDLEEDDLDDLDELEEDLDDVEEDEDF